MAPTDTTSEAVLTDWLQSDTIPEDKHYRMTGELPTAEREKPGDSHVEDVPKDEEPPVVEAEKEIDGDTPTDPPSVPTQRETKSEKRWRELSERVGNTDREVERLRRENEELRRKPSETRETADPQSAAKEEIKATDPEPELPLLSDIDPSTGKPFATIAEWQVAVKAAQKKLSAWLLAQVEGRFAKATQEREQTATKQQRDQDIATKLLAGKEEFPDFEQVALSPELTLPQGSPADEYLRSSKQPHRLLYHLGKHPEILNGFYRYVAGKDDRPGHLTGVFEQLIPPMQQMAELARIEATLTAPVAPTRPTATPAKRVTNAPPPPREVDARSTSTKSDIEEAVAANDGEGDFEAYKARQNARDIARRKGR